MTTPRLHTALALIAALAFALAACSDDTSGSGAGNNSANTNNSTSSTNNNGTTAACTPGELGCACADGNSCGAGLTCLNALCIPDTGTNNSSTGTNNSTTSTNNSTTSTNNATTSTNNGTTTPPSGPGLRVDSADARSCEAVLVDPNNRVEQVAFADGVTGRFMRRGERVAVAFIASDGASFAADSVRLVLAEGAASLDTVTLTRVTCSDAQGDPIDAADVTIVND